MRLLPIVLATALLAGTAFAQERELFPSDFKLSPCAADEPCKTFNDAQFASAGREFYGYQVDESWVLAHSAEMRAAFAPYCKKVATCLGTANNLFAFCDDVVAQEARAQVCPKLFPKNKSPKDYEQCQMYMELYWLGVDQNNKVPWEAAQACAAKQHVTHAKPPEVWVTPALIPYGYSDYVTFHAIDPETHVPLYGDITFENQKHYAEANPAGSAAPYYPMKLPFKWQRVPSPEGHTLAAAPFVTIAIPDYPPVVFRLNAEKPKIAVEMTPAAQDLKPGRNTIKVTAKEEPSGTPIDARIMSGTDEIGTTGQEITIEIPKSGKRPEIWFKPFLNRYDDVVLVPGGK